MAKKPKTRRQIAKMVARRIRPAKVRVVSIQRNTDGTWHPVTVGEVGAIASLQLNIEAIVGDFRRSYELIHRSHASVFTSARWLNWTRRRSQSVASPES